MNKVLEPSRADALPAVLFLSFAHTPRESRLIAYQREAGERKAGELNLRIVHEITEMGAAALDFKKRLAFQALLMYFEEHPDVHYAVFPGLHRVSRNLLDFQAIQQRFEELGVEIVLATGEIGSPSHAQAADAEFIKSITQVMARPVRRDRRRLQRARRKSRQDTHTTTGDNS